MTKANISIASVNDGVDATAWWKDKISIVTAIPQTLLPTVYAASNALVLLIFCMKLSLPMSVSVSA